MLETIPSMGSFSVFFENGSKSGSDTRGPNQKVIVSKKSFSEIIEGINERREKKITKKKVVMY